VLISGGYGLAQATAARVAEACSDARVKLHPVWDDRRAEVERHLATGGPQIFRMELSTKFSP